MPTLDEVFESLAKDFVFNVEIKLADDETTGIEAVVARCIQRHQTIDRVIVSSFHPSALLRLRKSLPEVMIGALTAPGVPFACETLFGQLQHEARHPWREDVDHAYMRWARDNDFFVNVWTVNDPERALQLKALGVNAVITDNPDRIAAAFSP